MFPDVKDRNSTCLFSICTCVHAVFIFYVNRFYIYTGSYTTNMKGRATNMKVEEQKF